MTQRHPLQDRIRFREARARLGLTAARLADLLHIRGGDRTIRRWEAGERDIPGPAAVALAHLVSLNDLGFRPIREASERTSV